MITKMIKNEKNYFKDFQCVAGSVLHNCSPCIFCRSAVCSSRACNMSFSSPTFIFWTLERSSRSQACMSSTFCMESWGGSAWQGPMAIAKAMQILTSEFWVQKNNHFLSFVTHDSLPIYPLVATRANLKNALVTNWWHMASGYTSESIGQPEQPRHLHFQRRCRSNWRHQGPCWG